MDDHDYRKMLQAEFPNVQILRDFTKPLTKDAYDKMRELVIGFIKEDEV